MGLWKSGNFNQLPAHSRNPTAPRSLSSLKPSGELSPVTQPWVWKGPYHSPNTVFPQCTAGTAPRQPRPVPGCLLSTHKTQGCRQGRGHTPRNPWTTWEPGPIWAIPLKVLLPQMIAIFRAGHADMNACLDIKTISCQLQPCALDLPPLNVVIYNIHS